MFIEKSVIIFAAPLFFAERQLSRLRRMQVGFEKAFTAGGRSGKFDTISPN